MLLMYLAQKLIVMYSAYWCSLKIFTFYTIRQCNHHSKLTVQGSTTTIDSTTINISSSFTFEGPIDAHETILSCGTPTADITVMLPQYNAAETVHMAVLADAATEASADVTAAEFALLDASAASVGTDSVTSGDGFLHNDGGVLKHTSIDKIIDAAVVMVLLQVVLRCLLILQVFLQN